MPNEIKISEIIPDRAEFSLKATGKTYRLRPVSIRDQEWMRLKFGDELQKILSEVRTKELCLIAFHQMDLESQKEFSRKEVEFIDEETGESKTLILGGAELLREALQGWGEVEAMYLAIMKTIGLSRPIITELKNEFDQFKKKSLTTLMEVAGHHAAQAEMEIQMDAQAQMNVQAQMEMETKAKTTAAEDGQKSLISSPQSTDGAGMTSQS